MAREKVSLWQEPLVANLSPYGGTVATALVPTKEGDDNYLEPQLSIFMQHDNDAGAEQVRIVSMEHIRALRDLCDKVLKACE